MRHLSPPDECPVCCALHGVLTTPGVEPRTLTTADLATAVDRAPRTIRVHLTVLVDAARVDVDRRTPMPGAYVGPRTRPLDQVQTPGQWAATVTLHCRGCRRVLTVLAELAGPDWVTRGARQTELGRYAQMTPKTVQVHLGHLGTASLLRVETEAIVREGGRYQGRRPDAYVLLSGIPLVPEILTAPGTDLDADTWYADAATDLLAAVRWFGGPAVGPGDFKAAIARLTSHLRDGIPERALYRMLTRRDIRREAVSHPYALLCTLCPPLGSQYIASAATVTSARATCPSCGVIYADPETPPGITCSECTAQYAPF